MAGIAVAALASPLADRAIAAGRPVTAVRRAAMALALLGPAAALCAAAAARSRAAAVASLTAALGLARFSVASLYCVHQDMSPRHAAAALALTNTAGAVAGLLGVSCTGRLLRATGGDWGSSLFGPCILARAPPSLRPAPAPPRRGACDGAAARCFWAAGLHPGGAGVGSFPGRLAPGL